MRLFFPLLLLVGASGIAYAAVAKAEKKKAVRGATLDPILSDEEADEVLSDAGDDIQNQINQCSNGIGQSFTFDDIGEFASEFGYDVFWSDIALTNQTPKNAYTLNDKSRAFDATVCSFMVWNGFNTWVVDQVTNAELAGWRANQDLTQIAPPPFFPQFE